MSKRTRSDEMVALCARVQRWRERSGGRGSRVPDAIWRAAVRVASRAGVCATARASRLNYGRIKERLDQAGGNGALVPVGARGTGDAETEQEAKSTGTSGGRPALGGAKARFVAVRLPTIPAHSQATIEVVSRHGARMRVEVRGEVDVGGLLEAFWSQPS